jgi:hypothetical protein
LRSVGQGKPAGFNIRARGEKHHERNDGYFIDFRRFSSDHAGDNGAGEQLISAEPVTRAERY